MVRLLTGIFGSTEAYALMDFQLLPAGPVVAAQITGEQEVGGATLTTPTIGARLP